VLAGVINLGNVVKFDKAVLVHVQFVVGGPDVCRSSLVEVTLEESEEFIEIDCAVAVSVKFSQ